MFNSPSVIYHSDSAKWLLVAQAQHGSGPCLAENDEAWGCVSLPAASTLPSDPPSGDDPHKASNIPVNFIMGRAVVSDM